MDIENEAEPALALLLKVLGGAKVTRAPLCPHPVSPLARSWVTIGFSIGKMEA